MKSLSIKNKLYLCNKINLEKYCKIKYLFFILLSLTLFYSNLSFARTIKNDNFDKDTASSTQIELYRIEVRNIEVALKDGAIWGTKKEGYFCGPHSKLKWNKSPYDSIFNNLTTYVSSRFRQKRFTSYNSDNSQIINNVSTKNNFIVTGLLTKIDSEICTYENPFKREKPAKGYMDLSFNWNLYSASDGRLLATFNTSASYNLIEFSKEGPIALLNGTIDKNVEALINQKQFNDLINQY